MLDESMPPMPAPGPVTVPDRELEERALRSSLIDQLERERDRPVLVYVTDPRGGALGTGIGDDVLPLLHEHLHLQGHRTSLDLFLATGGGHTMAANNIVHLLREYCDDLTVLVPHRAMSAGTLIALGANAVLMGPLGRIGPVDPTVSNDFNPKKVAKNSETQDQSLGISVEDVAGFLALAKDRAELDADGMREAFRVLSENVHPLALGNVHRQSLLIRSVSRRLLELHLDQASERERIERIVDVLTEKLYFHGYQISRYEAETVIGLPVKRPGAAVESIMWELYAAYRRALHLDSLVLNGPFRLDSGIIESRLCRHVYSFTGSATKKGDELDVHVTTRGWRHAP